MIRWLAVILGSMTISCGSDSADPDLPDSCSPAQRYGTYLVHAETISGSCGDLGDALVRVDGPGVPAQCDLLADDLYTRGDCTLQRVIRCPDGDGYTVTTGITTQISADGSMLNGTITIESHDAVGAAVCSGTYRVTYSRQ